MSTRLNPFPLLEPPNNHKPRMWPPPIFSRVTGEHKHKDAVMLKALLKGLWAKDMNWG